MQALSFGMALAGIKGLGLNDQEEAMTVPDVVPNTTATSTWANQVAAEVNNLIALGPDPEAVRDIVGNLLVAGANMAITVDDVANTVTLSAGTASSYTAENARQDIGAALTGIASEIVVTPDDTADLIYVGVDPIFTGRVAALENARALLNVKDALSGGSDSYVNLPGVVTAYVSTPSVTALNPTGDYSVVVRLQIPSSAPASHMLLAAKWGSSNATGQFRFYLETTGQMQVVSTVDGVAASTTTTTAATVIPFDGTVKWLRFTRKSSDGTIDFQTAVDAGPVVPTTWTTFQLNRASTAGVLQSTTQALTMGSYNNGASGLFTGHLYRVMGWGSTSIAGTPLYDMNAADYVSGTTWVGPQTRTWTLNGTATVVSAGGSVSNTNVEFNLAETDVFTTVPLARHDTIFWSAQGGIVNTSGSNQNFTPRMVINGVQLFTFTAISIPSSAGNVYRWECELRAEISANDGTTQAYALHFRIYNASAGTFTGTQTVVGILTEVGGTFAGAVTTLTSVPAIQLKMTMGTALPTISSGVTLVELALQKG